MALNSGYAFKLDSKKPWNRAPNDDWEIVVIDAPEGKKLGKRYIDDALCVVYETPVGIIAQTVVSGA